MLITQYYNFTITDNTKTVIHNTNTTALTIGPSTVVDV